MQKVSCIQIDASTSEFAMRRTLSPGKRRCSTRKLQSPGSREVCLIDCLLACLLGGLLSYLLAGSLLSRVSNISLAARAVAIEALSVRVRPTFWSKANHLFNLFWINMILGFCLGMCFCLFFLNVSLYFSVFLIRRKSL